MFAGGNYIVLVVAANTDSAQSQRWAKNFLISFGQDLGVNQVIKVIVTCILLKIYTRTNGEGAWISRLKFLMDFLTIRAIAMASTK